MRDVLEDSTDCIVSGLLTQQKILDSCQGTLLSFIGEMIPGASITIQHGWRLDVLFSLLTPLALERVMSVAVRLILVHEKLTQTVN